MIAAIIDYAAAAADAVIMMMMFMVQYTSPGLRPVYFQITITKTETKLP